MSLQSIINISNGLTINRRKVIGIQYTRNEIPRISETPTLNPWRFSIELPTNLRYGDARTIIEAIDTLDRKGSEIITFSNNPSMNWIFRYQGSMLSSQISNVTVVGFVGNQLTLTNLPAIGTNRVLFEPNDLIQLGDNPYPFTVTEQVVRGSGATVTLTTHRPNILTSDVSGLGITVGADCQFKVFCPNMPVYKLFPGASMRTLDGTLISNALIEWSDSFTLYEYLGTV